MSIPAPATAKLKLSGTAVQRAWLDDHLDRPLAIRLVDGTSLRAVLLAHDAFVLTLRPDGAATSLLLYKHAIASLAAGDSWGEGGAA